MKKVIKVVIITCLFIFVMSINNLTLNAAIDAYINDSSVRIRTGPGTDNSIIVTVNTNTSISLVDKTLYSGTGCSSKWYKVTYNGKTGYVCSQYVTIKDTNYTGVTVQDWTVRTHSNSTPLRTGPGTSYSSAGTLVYGTNVTIISEHASGSGCSEKWYRLRYHDNKTAYTCGTNIHKKSDITSSDATYEVELKAKGFPDSYIPYLVYLHKKYPNWTFIADVNKLDFTESVSGQDNKNLMQTGVNAYRKSSTPAEGSSWYKATSGVIAFFLDPRNFLNEKNIFMFENLAYDNEFTDQYLELVKSVFGSGSLGNEKYTIPMVSAGAKLKVSPVHIASRIRQEVGASGSDSTNGNSFTWKGKKYSGYYNFFNIGAYETTIDGVKYSAVTRGLAYAAILAPITRSGKPWNDIETAMIEGVEFLANNYINSGQNTLYYQKFNTYPGVKSPHTHQYMTNVQAPTSEGSTTHSTYKDAGVLNTTFTFSIPVYSNMPAFTSLPVIGDTNNELSSITVNGTLISGFDPDVITYTHYVSDKSESININATTVSKKSTISGTGTIELPSNENIVSITVTSETGEKKIYSVKILKTSDTTTVNEILSKVDVKMSGTTLTKLKEGTTVTTLHNSILKAGPNASIVIKDAGGKVVTGTDTLKTNYTITITTAIESKTYTISVNGDTSGDGKITILDLLQVQKHIVGSSKLKGTALSSADTSGDGKVTILDLLQVQKHIVGDKKL